MSGMTRRKLLAGTLGAAGAVAAGPTVLRSLKALNQPRARVSAMAVPTYGPDLADRLVRGIREYPEVVARARAGTVLLKPNLVEFHADRPANTDARFLAATVEAFHQLGARDVMVGEAPGHRRDTELLVERSGVGALLRERGTRFVDLNVDATEAVSLPHNFTGLGSMRLPRSLGQASLVVSVAKLKTHHWAGCTLSMKNLFGVVPGSVYGWPKNVLHWKGIPQSIVDLWDTVRPGFALIDGVVGMEGDGPLEGTPIHAGAVFMGDNLPAVDATAARFMGLVPERVAYLPVTADLGGTIAASRIQVVGDTLEPVPFEVLAKFDMLRA